MKKISILIVTHFLFAMFGFVVGIYTLPIITAPNAPTEDEMITASAQAEFTGQFKRDLKGSDFLHWGDGKILVGRKFIVLEGSIAPGPDYNLYLSPKFVETESEFKQLKSTMIKVDAVRTFENFIVAVSDSVDPSKFNTVIIWCESFGEFISAAKYQ
ncbi:MAG: DM13 domain-containing protein [Gammaproteobacteria bacterium]|nr:DM13 domain-containing protein [Gammaproteobacteria bacterium]